MFSGSHLTEPFKTPGEKKNWLKKENQQLDFGAKLPILSQQTQKWKLGPISYMLKFSLGKRPSLLEEAHRMWWYALTSRWAQLKVWKVCGMVKDFEGSLSRDEKENCRQ